MRVRESNNVLQAVQMNQTLFIKLGNKRNVLGCLADFIKHRLRYGVQTSKTCFIKQCWMMFYGDVLLDTETLTPPPPPPPPPPS